MLNLVLNLIQYRFSIWLRFFLPLADTPFIPVHRTGFSGATLIIVNQKNLSGMTVLKEVLEKVSDKKDNVLELI